MTLVAAIWKRGIFAVYGSGYGAIALPRFQIAATVLA